MAAGQSPLSCCMQVAGAQEPRSYSVRPWHHSLALARKVNHRLIFSHSAKKDSTQLRFLSLPAKKTVWERERIKRGGEGNSWGHLDWTSSKTQRVVFFEEKKAGRGKKSCLGHQTLFWATPCLDCKQSHQIPELFLLSDWECFCQITIKEVRWWRILENSEMLFVPLSEEIILP